MRSHRLWLLTLASAGLLALATQSSARADYLITIDGAGLGAPIVISQGGFGDTGAGGPTAITVDTTTINALLVGTGYSFTSLTATSNQSTGGASDVAFLTINGVLVRDTSAGSATPLSITTTNTDYSFPNTTAGRLDSSTSDTLTNITTGNRSFQSFYDATNIANGTGTPSGVTSFIFPPGQSADSGSAPPVNISPFTLPYSLTNTTIVSLGASSSANTLATDQFSGSTTVTAVPEPASMALLLIGGTAIGLVARRRNSRLAE